MPIGVPRSDPSRGGLTAIASPMIFTFGTFDVPASKTALLIAAFEAPCDLRIERISWNCTSVNGASANAISFYKHATAIQTSGATALTDTAVLDLDVNVKAFQGPATMTAGITAKFLDATAGVRSVSQGQFVFAAITTDATEGGTTGVNVIYTCIATGYSITTAAGA